MEIDTTTLKKQKGHSLKMTLLFLLLTIPFFPIDYLLDTNGWAGKAYTACQILAGVVILFLLFKNKLFKKLSPLLLLMLGLLVTMCLGSVFSGDDLKRSLQYAFGTLVICLIMEYGMLKDIRNFLLAEIIYFGGISLINFFSIILYPGGLYRYLGHYEDTWFLGFKSGHIVYLLAFLFFTAMYMVLCDKRAKYLLWGASVMAFVSSLLVQARAPMLILIPVMIVAFIPKILKFSKVMNILTYTGIAVFLDLLFVVFRGQELFHWLIVGIFHRRMDLTYRTDVWDSALRSISEQPVLGHGYKTFVYTNEIITTHNEYLEVLYKAGIVGLVIFLAILTWVIVRLFKNRKLETSQWISLFLGGFLFLFVMEQYAFANFFYILLFAFRCGELQSMSREQALFQPRDVHPPSEPGRTRKSARNFLFTALANVTAILIGLIAQKLFINILGLEYAGLNGLFTNVISLLGIVDLGIGEAVIFHLYKPLKEGDQTSILSLMRFYRKAFHIVAGIIAVIGVCLIPALPYIAKTTEANVNLTVIYLIFLADVVFSYFLSYKRAILYADQKNFIISMIHMGYLVGMNLAQLLVLYFTHDYYAYLLTKLAFRILENVVITAVANRKYPYLKQKEVLPLKPEVRADIKKKVGALFFHKIGTFVVTGTDNILISVFFNLTTAGLYNNYFIVIDAATKLINPAIAALTPSVGHMLVSEDKSHTFAVFRRIRFMNFWIASFAATTLFVLIQTFIGLWFGDEYLLPLLVITTLSFQFFQALMRGSYNVFQDAAGIFYENRFVPLVESALNLVASIALLKVFGLAGVFMGTIISSLALWAFSYPKFVYTKLFDRSLKNYIAETLGYLGVFLLTAVLTALAALGVNRLLPFSGILLLIADLIVCVLVSNGLLALIFCRSDNFRYFLGLVKNRLD